MPVPTLLRLGFIDCQVCVPRDWTDEQVEAFAEQVQPLYDSGLQWEVLPDGHAHLDGDPQRNQCEAHPEMVHVKLEC